MDIKNLKMLSMRLYSEFLKTSVSSAYNNNSNVIIIINNWFGNANGYYFIKRE